jgi:transcriptional regulator with XRE-family HTH domain
MDRSLTENRLLCKRYAVYEDFRHLEPMKSQRAKEPKTVTQAMFLHRVNQELERQKVTRNGLCQRPGAPTQSTFNEVMNGADPRLETVHQIAAALNVPAWTLFVERPASGFPYNVTEFPTPPAPTEGFLHRADRKDRAKKSRDKKSGVR